ncbi:hypothetical protein EVAR_95927_1 [Eumeta japonica]|uniref:Uncharacterized protein n=1 Tax=Eumeta variegata TaxID=151549 RepID=A0A4C1V7L7_EUMVA|nr:hypothetical protein EVAR_95927_1 [Eumeta japonica]
MRSTKRVRDIAAHWNTSNGARSRGLETIESASMQRKNYVRKASPPSFDVRRYSLGRLKVFHANGPSYDYICQSSREKTSLESFSGVRCSNYLGGNRFNNNNRSLDYPPIGGRPVRVFRNDSPTISITIDPPPISDTIDAVKVRDRKSNLAPLIRGQERAAGPPLSLIPLSGKRRLSPFVPARNFNSRNEIVF